MSILERHPTPWRASGSGVWDRDSKFVLDADGHEEANLIAIAVNFAESAVDNPDGGHYASPEAEAFRKARKQ